MAGMTGSRLLIWVTGGGSREPIDAVRYIGNYSTGRLALTLIHEARRRGHAVRAFLAESLAVDNPARDGVEWVCYVTSRELEAALLEGRGRTPDVIFHAAAVADYAPEPQDEKVGSGKDSWTLVLKPLPKIAPLLKKAFPTATLVMFKLESGITTEELQVRAMQTASGAGADFIFANLLLEVQGEHRGWLLSVPGGEKTEATGRESIARLLLDAVEGRAQRTVRRA